MWALYISMCTMVSLDALKTFICRTLNLWGKRISMTAAIKGRLAFLIKSSIAAASLLSSVPSHHILACKPSSCTFIKTPSHWWPSKWEIGSFWCRGDLLVPTYIHASLILPHRVCSGWSSLMVIMGERGHVRVAKVGGVVVSSSFAMLKHPCFGRVVGGGPQKR